MNHRTIADMMKEKESPVIAIDNQGLITYANQSFTQAYGWTEEELTGQVITVIMPPYMRDAHNFGFSRFIVSEHPRILSTPLELPVQCKDGKVIEAEHYILGEKLKNIWRFAATIIPKTKVT